MWLALRILRPHSLTLTLTLTVSLSLSLILTVSLISLISLSSLSSLSHLSPISFSSLSYLSHLSHISLISLSSLSLSPLSVSCLSVSLLSLLSQEDPGKEPHIKDSSPLPPKRAPCFFLPRWSASFRPPLGLKFANGEQSNVREKLVIYFQNDQSPNSNRYLRPRRCSNPFQR